MSIEEQKKERWRAIPLCQRLHYMANEMHVNHPAFVRALIEIKSQVQACEQLEKGAGLLLLAPTGSGKSHLSRYLKRLWPDNHEGWKSQIPVVSFSLPSIMTKRSIAVAMLRSIQPTASVSNKDETLEKRIEFLLQQIGTRVIVIDNVHDITARRQAGGIKEIGDWLRDLIENSRRLVILLGAPSALEIIFRNPQLRRRSARQIRMDYFKINTKKRYDQFRLFLHRLDCELPLALSTEIDDDLTKRIFYATNGVFDYVFSLFSQALCVAVEAGREQLTIDDFEEGFRLVMGDAVKCNANPFLLSNGARALDKEGEPFHNLSDTWDNPVRKD